MSKTLCDSNSIDPEHIETIRAQIKEISRASEDQLLSVLESDRSHILAKVRACLRLAHVGSDASLALLEKLAAEEMLAKSARFAHALICFRGGRLSSFFETGNAVELRIDGPVSFLRSHAASFENVLVSPSLEELGIEVMRIGAFAARIRSGKTKLLVLPTKEAIEHGFLGLVATRPALLGVLLQYTEEHRNWVIRSYLLGAPRSGRVWVALMRNDGEIEYAGSGDGNQVILNSLECPGALPAQIQIHTAGTDLRVTGFTAVRRQRMGQVVTASRAPRESRRDDETPRASGDSLVKTFDV